MKKKILITFLTVCWVFASVMALNTLSTFNKTVNAAETTYTVTLDANGGDVSQSSTSVTYDSTSYNSTYGEFGNLPTPTQEGYVFKGWTASSTIISKTITASSTNDTAWNSMLPGIIHGTGIFQQIKM